MRTPSQIKMALARCRDDHCICDECVFSDGNVKKWRSLMSDALIYIEQLESMQYGRWISVEERMPPEDTKVLVYATEKIKGFGSVTAICEYSGTTSMFGNKTGRYDWSSPWEYFHVDYKITHWMPLPELPKEDKNED